MIFKKSLIFMMIFFVVMLSNLYAKSTSFRDKNSHINLKYTDDWSFIDSHGKYVFSLVNEDQISSINISVYNFSQSVTVNGFQINRRTAFYDGWQSYLEKPGSEYHTVKANADASYIAVYSSKYIDPNFNIKRKIVAEYYYLKDMKGYVISISTKQSFFKALQPSLKSILDSFWIGLGEQPDVIEPEKLSPEWEMIGKNPMNQFSIDADFDVTTTNNVVWDVNLERSFLDKNGGMVLPILAKGNLYLANNENLYSFQINDGKKNWTYDTLGKIRKSLLYHQDIIYYIAEETSNYLYAVLAQNGNILFKIPLENKEYSHPILFRNKLFIYDGPNIKAYEADNGKLKWQRPLNVKIDTYAVATGNSIVVVTKDNGVAVIDSETGNVAWRKQFAGKILSTPIINNNSVIIAFKEWYSKIYACDLVDGKFLWESKENLASYNKISSLSVASNILFLTGEMGSGGSLFSQILAIDANTGEIVWRNQLDSTVVNFRFPPIVVNNSVYILTKKNTALFDGEDLFLNGFNYVTGKSYVKKVLTLLTTDEQREYALQFYRDYLLMQVGDRSLSISVLN